jgi:hypothetical protein
MINDEFHEFLRLSRCNDAKFLEIHYIMGLIFCQSCFYNTNF